MNLHLFALGTIPLRDGLFVLKARKRTMLSALHKMHLLTGSMRHLRPSSASFPASKLLFHIVLDVRWSVLFAVDCLAAAGDSEGIDAVHTLKFAKFHPPLADASGHCDSLRRQLAMQGQTQTVVICFRITEYT